MATYKNRHRLWVYLDEEDHRRLEQLSKAARTLNEVSILTTLVSAALKACDEAGSRIPLPLKFRILDELPEQSSSRLELPTPKRK